MTPHRTPAVVLPLCALLVAMAMAACATRGPATMRVGIVGRGGDAPLVAELEERLVAELVEVPRVDPIGATGAKGERDPFISALAGAPDDEAACALAAHRALTHLLIADVSRSVDGLRAELRALAVDSGAVVWRASWDGHQGGLGAAVAPWVRALLTTTGHAQGMPPVTADRARRALADLSWSGYAALQDGDAALARAAFAQVLARAPARIRALQGMARVAIEEEAYDDALSLAERALNARSGAAMARDFVADTAARVARGRRGEAEELATAAEELAEGDEPDPAEAKRLSERAQSRHAEAIAAYRRAYALDVRARPAAAARAALGLAATQAEGDPAAAVATLSAALARLAASPCALPEPSRPVNACGAHAFAEVRGANYDLIDRLTELSAPSEDAAEAAPALIDDLAAAVDALGARLAADPTLVTARDCAGAGLLHVAAAADDVARIDLLLAAGARVDALDDHRWTPLHRAARAGSLAAADRLLARGADLATRDADGRTPLHVAAIFGQVEMVRRMVAGPAPLAAMTRNGETALHLAARVGDVAVIRALLAAGATVEAPAWRGRTPLALAALRDLDAAVRVLAAAGADPNLVDTTGQPLVIGVVEVGAVEALRALADLGADLNVKASWGRTALHRAASSNNVAVVRALLELGAKPTPVDESARTPLHEAAAEASAEVVAALLAAHAAVDPRDGRGRTPLALAAARGEVAIVKALLAAGADPAVADERGQTALDRAVIGSHVEVVQLLAPPPSAAPPPNEENSGEAPARDPRPLLLAAHAKASAATFDALLAGGWSVDDADEDGATALMVAAAKDYDAIVAYLLDRGADASVKDAAGRTAAHRAARTGALDVLATLLRRAPTLVAARDVRGLTPLHHAAAGGRSMAIEALVAAGADPTARTVSGAGAADVAAAFGHTELARGLLRRAGGGPDVGLAAALGEVALVRRLAQADRGGAGAPGVTGLTPLMLAIVNDQPEVVQALFDLGVDLEVAVPTTAVDPGFVGQTAIGLAGDFGAEDVVTALSARGVEESPHLEAAWRKDTGIFLELNDVEIRGPRFVQIFGMAGHGEGAGGGGASSIGEAVVPVGAEPLGIQIREQLAERDTLVRSIVLPKTDSPGLDDGWDEVASRCMARRDHAAAARELASQLVIRAAAVAPDGPAVGLVHHNLARVRFYQVRYADAERELELATEGTRDAPFVHEVVAFAWADLRAAQGRNTEAERGYREVLTAWEDADAFAPEEWRDLVRSALANLLTEMARYVDARTEFAKLVSARSGRHRRLAIARNNQAVLFDLLGDHTAAAAGYEAARALLDPRADATVQAIVTNNFAFARLREGDAARAASLAAEAVALLDAPPWSGRPHYARGRALMTQAAATQALGDDAGAGTLLARAESELRAVYGEVHGVVADVIRRRAELDLRSGNHAEALERLYDALVIARLAAAPEYTWRVEDDLARALVAAGRPRAAVAMGKLAVNTLEGLRGTLGGLGGALARAYLADRTAPYRRLAGLLIDGGRVMEAQLVLDMLKDEEDFAFTRASRAAASAPLLGKEKASADAVEGVAGAADLASREALQKYIRGFKRAVAAALAAVDEDDEQGAAVIEGRLDQLSLDRIDDLRAFLEDPDLGADHAAFVQIFLSDDKVRILLTQPQQETRPFESKVSVKRVYQLISRLREQLQDEDSDPRATARELYDALLRPVRDALDAGGVKTLMVWLDGALRYVPLAALHDGEGWLVESFRLAMYTPVTHAALKDRRSGSWRVNAFGMSKEAPGFDPLPGVPDELDAIVAQASKPGDPGAMKGALWLDGAFTGAALIKALQDGGVQAVHVASHYAFDPEGDEGSFLLLGDKSHLTLAAIRRIARRGRLGLVTFSACNTAVGLGALAGAESSNDPLGLEVEGLGNVVQRELSTAVLATLWPVVDKSTVAFMRELDATLQADPTLSKAAAVQRAQLRLLHGEVDDGHPKSWVHPRFWAPFVLMGNWR